MTEMQKLDKYLTEHNIKHTYGRRWPETERIMPDYREGGTYDGGYQIVVNDNKNEYLLDAICGRGSFGFKQGLIEIMGVIVPDDAGDSVEGYLTADDVIKRIEKYSAGNEPVLNN